MDTHGGIATSPNTGSATTCTPTVSPADTHGGIASKSTSRSTKDTHGGIAGAQPATTTACPTPPVRKGDDGNDGNQNSDQGNND